MILAGGVHAAKAWAQVLARLVAAGRAPARTRDGLLRNPRGRESHMRAVLCKAAGCGASHRAALNEPGSSLG